MSNIEELLKKCDKGVPFFKLDELVEFRNGKGHEKNIVDDGKYIVVNSKFISTDGEVRKYSNEQICPLNAEEILMVMSDLPNGRALAKCFLVDEDDKYTLNQRICALKVRDSEKINYKYLYYYLNRNKQLLKFDNGVDQTNLRKDDILNISVAVPPMEVQCEIVHVLDDFTLLSAELSAELKARRIQYEYYRDKLLEPKEDWNCIQMNDICEIITKQTGFDYSATIKPSLVTEKNDNTLSFIQNKDFCGEYFNYATDYYIPKNIVERFPKITLDKPSILFSISGKIGNIGLFENKEKAFIGGAICICKLKKDNPIINRYILYYAQSKYGQKYLFKSIKAASHLNITVESIRNMKIFYPNKEQQEQIISKLVKLDKLCNDITEGLPAEIDARQKQYEYYRDKLLTFKKIINEG